MSTTQERLHHRDRMRRWRAVNQPNKGCWPKTGPRLDRTPTQEAIATAARYGCSFVMLGHGRFALVDTEDLERVSQLLWWRVKDSALREYAHAQEGVGKNRITIYMSRFVLQTDAPHVDHKDHNGLNNQKNNLRPCPSLNNHQNRLPQKHSSRFKGVTLMRGAKNPWVARIRVNTNLVSLGVFSNERDAALAYDAAAAKYFGEFAFTNQQAGLL